MKCIKINNQDGRIFVPQEHRLLYAKSPQVIVLEDFVRIYFCTCQEKMNGKYISEVAYVDMDKKFEKILNLSTKVIDKGELGCFDEHGIFPFSPLQHKNKIYAYTSGWSRRVSVSTDTGIGLAESTDYGKTFKRLGKGPVLSSSIEEPFLVVDGFVRVFEDVFHMWYIYGTDWITFENEMEPDRIYKIGHAVSKDGIEWKREGKQIIQNRLEYESQALPSVIKNNNKYHMFFCYRYSYDFRTNKDRSYRIGYAYSNDLKTWIRDDEKLKFDISTQGWASNMLCYPHAFSLDGKLYLLYNGNGFGETGFGIVQLEE